MFPAAFDYRAPTSLGEVLELLRQHGDEAKVMAGGQSLIPLLKLRLASPSLVLDLSRVPSLAGTSSDSGTLRIGARTRHVDVERDASLRTVCPLLAEAAPQISDPLVRNLGTVGGSLCHADPAGDWGSVMLALDADLVAASSTGERVIPSRDFFQGPFTTALRADEVIAEAARLAARAAEPRDDVRGSAAYKRDVVRVFVQRGLKTALMRARGGQA